MAATIILRWVEEGVSAEAELLESRAPETCRMIREYLPLEGRSIHGMYSGPELFIRADHLPPMPAEHQIHRAVPGDVAFWFQEGGRYHSGPAPMAEVLFIYARGAAIHGPDGQPTWVNLFASIRPESADAFYAVARRVRTEGPKLLRIEAGPDADEQH